MFIKKRKVFINIIAYLLFFFIYLGNVEGLKTSVSFPLESLLVDTSTL